MDETKKRDYKAEYKKFQSSTKAKKYRAELNKYNRQKGTYGNGDGKDASHKGGKIVGFEAQSKNRGRAEKSRLKKETVMSKKIYEVKIGKYDIGMGYKGNGLTIWNRNVEKAGDYKNIAHIDNNGKITNYEKRQPKEVTAFIQKTAQAMKDKPKGESVNEAESKIKDFRMIVKQNKAKRVDNMNIDVSTAKAIIKKYNSLGKNQKQKFIKQKLKNVVKSVDESINEFKNMSPGLKKALAQKGYGPLFFTIDQSKRQLKQMKYTKGEIEDTLFTMFGDQDPKIVKKIKESKIKESINEKKGAWFNSLFPKSKVQKAIEIAKEMGGNMTGATKKIEKFFPGMILNTDVQDALRKYNESINEQEMSIKDAFKDLTKKHGGTKALDILTSVLAPMGFEDPKNKKEFQQKLLKKMKEGLGDRISKISKKYAKGQKKSKKALKNKKGPYQEEINENSSEKAKIVKFLIKYGNNPKEVKPWVDKHYKKAKGDRSGATPAQLAQYISFLTANESVNEAENTNVEWNNFEKGFGDFFTTVLRLGKANTKLTGDKTDEKIMIKNYNKDVGKFYSLMKSWQRGQNESVNEKTLFQKKLDMYTQDKIDMPTFRYTGPVHKKASDARNWGQSQKIKKDWGISKVKGGHRVIVQESINEMTKRQAAETLKQLGGNKFIMMTGAKNFLFSDKGLGFKIGRNAKAVNYVHISLNGKDLYDMKFQKGTRVLKTANDVYNDQLQKMFTKYTGMYTSLGTMGR